MATTQIKDASSDNQLKVNSDGSININAAPTALSVQALRLDNTSTANVLYVGLAVVGSVTSAPVWQIKKVNQTTGIVITWAGSGQFNQIWDNRTSLTYA